MSLLLLACSKYKNRFLARGPAREMYTGTLFVYGLQYAKEQGLECLILSAKYGWLRPDEFIDRYDEKRRRPFDGPWPEGRGVYVGGEMYFGRSPERFVPLVDAKTMSQWIVGVGALLRERPKVKSRPQKVGGITWELYRFLLSGPKTRDEMYVYLSQKFGENPLMKATIVAQTTANRIGKERGATLHREGDRFWLAPLPGVSLLGDPT